MNSVQRTLVFVVVAAVSTGVAYTANQLTKPARLEGYLGFGEEFFRDFTDPSKASAIQVVSFDEATALPKVFRVENKDGWRIPSYHDYPADGKEQLAKAASSVIGLKRGALVTRRNTEHEHFGVIDPLDDEENTAPKGRGTRITIEGKDGIKLADFIIGKKVEGSEDKVYLRRTDEKSVYVVAAKFEVSTKFADWAETDLLKVSGWDLVRLRASQPKYNEDGDIEDVEVVEIAREKSSDPWKLPELDEATEELKTDDINAMVSTLDDLRLVGVRPRPSHKGQPILDSNLRVSRALIRGLAKELAAANQFPVTREIETQVESEITRGLLIDLKSKGFFLAKNSDGDRQIVSKEGELVASTKDGVLYRLTFGNVFSGTEEEIEIGSKEEVKKDDKADGKPGESPAKDSETKKPAKNANKGKKEDLKKSRYLFVRAEFDEKLLGEPPTEPVKPEPPPGVEPPPDLKSDRDTKKTDAAKKEDATKSDAPAKEPVDSKPDDKQSPDEKPTDSKKADEPAGAKGDDKVAASDDAKKEEPKKSDESKTEKSAEAKKSADVKEDAPADKPKAESKAAATESKDDKAKSEDKPAEKKADDEKPAETKTEESKKDEPKTDPKAEYQNALKRYDADKGRFNTELKVFESKIDSGKQKVKELNDRFADWYYVISNDSFDKLRLSRATLIKKKDKPAEKKDSEKPDSEKPDSEKPDAEKPDGDAAKPAEKPADTEQPAEPK
ncbi:MAG TPA: hypothetical protein VK137_10300 [Planctomycetaceae bacterium]|nr:hypothetical protein [Planctomycetaceae bacterium]